MATAARTVGRHHFLYRPLTSTSVLSPSSSLHVFHFRLPFVRPCLLSSSISALTHLSTSSSQTPLSTCDEEFESEEEEEQEEGEDAEESEHSSATMLLPSLPSPTLTVKEKKELASYAHSLGKKLKSQQVGKSGVTQSLAESFLENLESNELLKIKVHGNCPVEFIDVVKQLEKATGSVALSQVGRSMILYRPSISKMKRMESQGSKKVRRPRQRQPAAYPGIPRGQLSRSSKGIGRRS